MMYFILNAIARLLFKNDYDKMRSILRKADWWFEEVPIDIKLKKMTRQEVAKELINAQRAYRYMEQLMLDLDDLRLMYSKPTTTWIGYFQTVMHEELEIGILSINSKYERVRGFIEQVSIEGRFNEFK